MFRLSHFQALMKGLPRGYFERQVEQHRGDRYSKGFRCWDLLVAMLFGQLSGAASLRGLQSAFNAQSAHHYHLGTRALRRSTFSDACRTRPAAIFEATARLLMTQVGRKLRQQSEELLYLLDSTPIPLAGPGFAWTEGRSTRRTRGLKLHLLLDAQTQAPVSQTITPANVNDVCEGRRLPLAPGATYVFDKGYCDYQWWARIDRQGAFFVTRFKRNARLAVVEQRAIPAADQALILTDEIVHLSNRNPGGGRCRAPYPQPLRRIRVAREGKAPLVLATNDLGRPAAEIAARYRDRWQIELLFKWIKQHLQIKQYLGRSENAVRIQILCALIAYLLLALYRRGTRRSGTLWEFLSAIRPALFQRPEVEAAMDDRRRCEQRELARIQRSLFA